MAKFESTGNIDPFLHVHLKKGEKIYAESGAMVSMDTTLELKGQMRGGMMGALGRMFTAGESFFQQTIEATTGDGDTLLSPTLPGDIMVLDVGPRQFRLNDGAFLAAEDGVSITVRSQNLGQALFGGTGGFFIMETSGRGQLAISGFGAMFALEVQPGQETIVDNVHVVAWDTRLDYTISMATANQGFFSRLVNSVTSGEGLVNRFRGQGQVIVCSRNRDGFVGWLASKIGGRSSG